MSVEVSPKCLRTGRRQVQIDPNVGIERCLESGNEAMHRVKEMPQISNPDSGSLAHSLVDLVKTPMRAIEAAFFRRNTLAEAAANNRNREVVVTAVSIYQELDLFSGN